ncbi:hypothetical protein PSN45_001977 [Yamadazyma tenuis]|uniref:Uncharacterized protein n=1 Tax=Candida tenuis (strain ATCC 10573 / BCRC 21748 / CBS 615 / JCM 9827 / NBRC 10315 / NRRL Y-1498 / VKM Y-70) TaxID=590646 RepID=G3BD87_CANTC|nr:uncharacterized protein CANTEDRAFT_127339 [Yamadazyma tenuis ATCC 10573]EGV60267.1 hypothetical protein CANTEDRAFT_127339 [Yamadazyma tenuis ATCC 10573]WEJ94491.1 hypothetical protein PSN45_001977 [Yamadazyma tenuis]
MYRLIRRYSTNVHSIKSAMISKDFKVAAELVTKSVLSTTECTSLLKQCRDTNDSAVASIALELGKRSFKKNHQNTYFMLMSFINCNDLGTLRNLKQFWDKSVRGNWKIESSPIKALYYSIFVHTYSNLNQPVLALEWYVRTFLSISKTNEIASSRLPTVKLLCLLLDVRDCDGVSQVLNMVHEEETKKHTNSTQTSVVTKATWLNCLSMAAEENNYELMRTIYDLYLMKDFKNEGISDTDILFRSGLSEYLENKGVTKQSVDIILGILASNGDIERTLELIEFYHTHSVFKGESASPGESFIFALEAFCMETGPSDWEDAPKDYENYHDTSVEKILDLIGIYTARSVDSKLDYKDISNFMSNKFTHFKAYDHHIEAKLQQKESFRLHKELELVQHPSVQTSPFGNIMANMNILKSFVSSHVKFVQSREYPAETVTLFINCVLNHINVTSNFSGIIQALIELQNLNANFSEWLDQDSYDIILNSLAQSGLKMVSLHLFKYLRSRTKLTHEHYACFISSILRGDFHSQLHYYMYYYSKDYDGHIGPKTKHLLESLPATVTKENSDTERIIMNLDNLYFTIPEPDDPKTTKSSLPGFNRTYHFEYDSRDLSYISYLFK